LSTIAAASVASCGAITRTSTRCVRRLSTSFAWRLELLSATVMTQSTFIFLQWASKASRSRCHRSSFTVAIENPIFSFLFGSDVEFPCRAVVDPGSAGGLAQASNKDRNKNKRIARIFIGIFSSTVNSKVSQLEQKTLPSAKVTMLGLGSK
jgi:hypothetical protein